MFEEMLNGSWDLTVLDADPPLEGAGSLAVGDLDGDGRVEIVIGGGGALLWYRPETLERGVIAEGQFHVGLALEDLDGDGMLEVVAGHRVNPGRSPERWALGWYKAGEDLYKPWRRRLIDPETGGGPHDVLFADIDGDGEAELVANACYCEVPGVFIYKRSKELAGPWLKHEVDAGVFAEGLSVADLDGDGRLEILNGPYWYRAPDAGPLSSLPGGQWRRRVLAPGFREMCRTAPCDITGDGRPDVVVCESEYLDGRMSWFENRGPENPWVEHPMERGLYYAHSLWAGREREKGLVRVVVAEMAEGGWKAPPKRDARVIEYSTTNGGASWSVDCLGRGSGTHQATVFDIDGDGELEVVGKQWQHPKVQVWKRRKADARRLRFRHRFLDRDKPVTATDILAVDVDGDGRLDVVCGSWWYSNPSWQRHEIPGVYQVHLAFDIDGDGRDELIATRRSEKQGWYEGLTSELVWLKPVDPERGAWELHEIGTGTGDWPHGTVAGPLGAGGRPALVVGYHSASKGHYPEIFEIPDDPQEAPWPRRVLAELPYGEEMVACDIDGDGKVDLVAGAHWLENLGDGGFKVHEMAGGLRAARVQVADVSKNGRPDVVLGEEDLDFERRVTPLSRLMWLECPQDPRTEPWKMHVIDKVRCPHSVAVADLDNDGEPEIVCGEHDPFYPYRTRCRLLLYRKAEPGGRAWTRYVLDDRFEHHDGAKVFEVAPGQLAVVSHGWQEGRYVHLWEAC